MFGHAILMSLTLAVSSFANAGTIPSNATSAGNLDGSSQWQWSHDRGTPGSSVGSSSYAISNPSLDKAARELYVAYSHHGGERYHLSFGHDESATHFVYDTQIFIADPSQLANLEMDMNQVMANGRTVILGTQCSSYSGTWEFVKVSGGPHWNRSNIPCNPKAFKANTWHHIQIASHRDQSGNAYYDWVNVDGKQSYFNGAHGPASMALGWQRGDLLLNMQLDGASGNSGSIRMYLDKLTVYRW